MKLVNKKVVVDDAGFDVSANVRYQSCWFCDVPVDQQSNDCWFTFEFDSWFHPSCLKKAMIDPEDTEASIIANEYRAVMRGRV